MRLALCKDNIGKLVDRNTMILWINNSAFKDGDDIID
jgi:hypothetical protein